MRLAQLLRPDPDQRLVSGLGGGVHGLSCNAEPRASRRDKHDPTALGNMGLDGLGEEDRAADIAVEVGCVELRGGIDEVGFEALGGTSIGTVVLDRITIA